MSADDEIHRMMGVEDRADDLLLVLAQTVIGARCVPKRILHPVVRQILGIELGEEGGQGSGKEWDLSRTVVSGFLGRAC